MMNSNHQVEIISKQVRDLITGDTEALKAIHNIFSPKVYVFCFQYLKSKEDTEEVVQDVFVKIWKSRERIDPDQSFTGYLFKIAKNTVLNKIRDRASKVVDYEINDNSIVDNGTYDSIFEAETRVFIDSAIEELPPKRREIFRLSRVSGLSNKEIAKKLGISVNTVEGQMRKSIQFIRQYISALNSVSIIISIYYPFG